MQNATRPCASCAALSTLLLVTLTFLTTSSALAQESSSDRSDEELLKLYEGLRVADVSDGMDVVGLRDVGLVDQRIRALWKDIEELDHQFRGIAVTARYVPHNRIVPNPMPPTPSLAGKAAGTPRFPPNRS